MRRGGGVDGVTYMYSTPPGYPPPKLFVKNDEKVAQFQQAAEAMRIFMYGYIGGKYEEDIGKLEECLKQARECGLLKDKQSVTI
jgi:hypothetical protein